MLKQVKHSSWQSTGKQLREARKQNIRVRKEVQTLNCVNLEKQKAEDRVKEAGL